MTKFPTRCYVEEQINANRPNYQRKERQRTVYIMRKEEHNQTSPKVIYQWKKKRERESFSQNWAHANMVVKL